MALALKIGQCSKQGPWRPQNNDSLRVGQGQDLVYCLLADGAASWFDEDDKGQFASRRGVDAVARELEKLDRSVIESEVLTQVIRKAIVTANQELLALSAMRGNLGTTIVAAVWHRGELYITSVGDSRAYLIRDERIEQLTVDDTVAQDLVDAGAMSLAEAKERRFDNILSRYLGTNEVRPVVKKVTARAGDRFLLCTDGLWRVLGDDQILHCLRDYADMQQCTEVLCREAGEAGTRDDVSCALMEIVES
jgi:protein phosphatase